MATGTVYLYDGFYALNPYQDWGSFNVALVASTYTFDKTHASWGSDIAPDESTGSGYSEAGISAGYLQLTGSPTEESDISADTNFAVCTVADFQYVVYYSNSTDVPILIIDLGSAQSVVDQGIAVTGTLFTLTPA